MRRAPRAKSLGLAPPPKKRRIANHGVDISSEVEVDDVAYRRCLEKLEKEESRTHKNRGAIKLLMQETTSRRRHWIVKDRPPVCTIIQKFPSLKVYENVSLMFIFVLCHIHV